MPTDTASVADRAAASNILKDFYLGPIRSQLNSQTLLAKRLMKREDVFEGSEIVIPIHTGRNVGTMARAENANLPASGRQGYNRLRFKSKYNYGRITLSGPLLASARTKAGAFIAALQSEVVGVTRDMKVELNRQMWGDGSGRIGTIQAVASTTSFTAKQVWDYAGQSARPGRFLRVGMRIQFEDTSAAGTTTVLCGSATGGSKILTVNPATGAFTIDAAPTTAVAVGDQIVLSADQGVGAVGIAETNFRGAASGVANDAVDMMGLVGICSGDNASNWPRNSYTGVAYSAVGSGKVYAAQVNGGATYVEADLQGLAASTEPTWLANTFFNSGVPRPLSLDLMQQVVDVQEVEGEAKATVAITTHACRRAYLNLMAADRRYPNQYVLDGGFKAVDFDDIPLVVEKDCPEGTMFFLHEPNLMIARMSDFYFLDKDGAVFSRVQNKDQFEATLAYYAELGCDRRNAQAVLGDVQI